LKSYAAPPTLTALCRTNPHNDGGGKIPFADALLAACVPLCVWRCRWDQPGKIATVFADRTRKQPARARSYFTGYPPSSPSIAILRDGKPIYMMHRHQIETRDAAAIAADLKAAFDRHCAVG